MQKNTIDPPQPVSIRMAQSELEETETLLDALKAESPIGHRLTRAEVIRNIYVRGMRAELIRLGVIKAPKANPSPELLPTTPKAPKAEAKESKAYRERKKAQKQIEIATTGKGGE